MTTTSASTERRRLSLPMVGVVLFLLVGCVVGPVKMTLVSNRPDTKFFLRKPSLNALPDEGWRLIGDGPSLTVTLPPRPVEVRATADGYRPKISTLAEPVPTQEFKFLVADAIGRSPAESTPRPEQNAAGLAPFSGHRHALIIGISIYRDSSLKTLRNARKDAEAIATFLRSPEGGNIPSQRVHLLVDDKATRSEIIKELLGMAAETNRGDLIFIYFAGHGQVQGGRGQARFLMPYDAEQTNPAGTALEQSNLMEFLDDAEIAERQVLILDCCFAGGPLVRGSEEDVWNELAAPGRVVMTSTKGNETALDGDRRSTNSPFAEAVLSVMKGDLLADHDDDGQITIKELFDTVSPLVRRAAQDAGGKMTPRLYGNLANTIDILPAR